MRAYSCRWPLESYKPTTPQNTSVQASEGSVMLRRRLQLTFVLKLRRWDFQSDHGSRTIFEPWELHTSTLGWESCQGSQVRVSCHHSLIAHLHDFAQPKYDATYPSLKRFLHYTSCLFRCEVFEPECVCEWYSIIHMLSSERNVLTGTLMLLRG